MKKTFLVLFILLTCLTISSIGFYFTYRNDINSIAKFNQDFEQYKEKEIDGTEIGTIINKAINYNEKNEISKDENGNYIENNDTSIKIDIYIKDNKTIYSMETIYKLGTAQFVGNFNIETFKCTKIEYHNRSKRVKYLYFEQI